MSDAESRYYEAREEAWHATNCLPCALGKPWLCKTDEEPADE